MDCNIHVKRKINPKETCNWLSTITYFFTLRLFQTGWKKELDENDIYEVLPELKSEKLGKKLEKKWQQEKYRNMSFLRLILINCFGKEFLFIGLSQISLGLIMFIQPVAISKIVAFFAPHQKHISVKQVYSYSSILVIVFVLTTFFKFNILLHTSVLNNKIRTAISSLIFRKILKIHSFALSASTIGESITMITKDLDIIESMIDYINRVWVAIIKIFITYYLIFTRIGYVTFVPLTFYIFFLLIQVYICKLSYNARIEACRKTEERLSMTQEMLAGIKLIKINCWEKYVQDKLVAIRQKEIIKSMKLFCCKIFGSTIGFNNIVISLYFSLLVHMWVSNNKTTEELAFFIISCFQNLRVGASVDIPMGMFSVFVFNASAKRITTFLTKDEIGDCQTNEYKTSEKKEKNKTFICLEDVTVKLNQKEVIKNLNLFVESGLLIITGPNGAGKTTLLKTILKEIKVNYGTVKISGSISYAPQEPWVFPSTIKQNILFGQKFDAKRYNEVLKVCGLIHDLNLMKDHDETLIGDRGINLSKGQQVRINLARTVYQNTEIYLLDDSLTGLDSTTGNFIFQECILKFLKNKLCIFITNNNRFIKTTNNVFYMDKGNMTTIMKFDNRYENSKIIAKEIFDMDDKIEENFSKESDNLLSYENIKYLYQEKKEGGPIKGKVYLQYLKFTGIYGNFLFIFMFCAYTVIELIDMKALSSWINLQANLTRLQNRNFTNLSSIEEVTSKSFISFTIYSSTMVTKLILPFILTTNFCWLLANIMKRLHKSLVIAITNSKMEFFDKYYFGNILNRFSKDLFVMDEQLSFAIYAFIKPVLDIIIAVIFISITSQYFIALLIVVFAIMYITTKYFMCTARNLKRLEVITRNPMIGYINSTLEGLAVIRACNLEKVIEDEFDKHQNIYTSTNFMLQSATLAYSLLQECIFNFIFVTVILFFLFVPHNISPAIIGTTIGQILIASFTLKYVLTYFVKIETYMTSTERILEYVAIKNENYTSGQSFENWPRSGKIRYENVKLLYKGCDKFALNNISFEIESNQKICIIGRTGAGKSSILSTLVRFYNIEGKIFIDDVDIKTINLSSLRSAIAIIPQDPILFTGTLRMNIDPTNSFTDTEIWNILNTVNLNDLLLETEISQNGCNFSAGKKQLICLVRALINKNKIVILDEATSSMDLQSEIEVEKLIKDNLKNCTVIVISHKLKHVSNYDKIMTMQDGEVVEFDNPVKLLENPNSLLHKMIQYGEI